MGHLGAMLCHLGAMLSHRGVMLGDLGAMLGLCWAILAYVGPSWSHLGSYVGPSWGLVGPKLGHLGAHLGPSWGYGGAGGYRVPPANFMSDLCCFLEEAKNTVNYEVFFDYA